jgi:hypothetical protein
VNVLYTTLPCMKYYQQGRMENIWYDEIQEVLV